MNAEILMRIGNFGVKYQKVLMFKCIVKIWFKILKFGVNINFSVKHQNCVVKVKTDVKHFSFE